jgi:hypothetical protein
MDKVIQIETGSSLSEGLPEDAHQVRSRLMGFIEILIEWDHLASVSQPVTFLGGTAEPRYGIRVNGDRPYKSEGITHD